MSSEIARPVVRSAAWRISLWATLAFTCGTIVVFIFLDRFVADDIQRRSDAWLTGEVEVLGDVAARTPNDALYSRVVGEIAELASHEVPNRESADQAPVETEDNDSVFFLQTDRSGTLKLWVGQGDGGSHLKAIQTVRRTLDPPASIHVPGYGIPFRVASASMHDGGRVYLGLSERDEQRVLGKLRIGFFVLWLSIVLLGFAIVFFTSRRTLSHVREISEAASQIGQADLTTRVPVSRDNDEIAQLAHTLNHMLDRIESTVQQLHTMTDALAHDLRSPLTAIRGKLETSLAVARDPKQLEAIASSIDELDRLTDFLNTSLDVAEAKANALRLRLVQIDLHELLIAMIALYEPSLSEKGITIQLTSDKPLWVVGDEALVHRMMANLFDNELNHLDPGGKVVITAYMHDDRVSMCIRDDGHGFDPRIQALVFSERVKGQNSAGHGLGLAFVGAVIMAHKGSVTVKNLPVRGMEIEIQLPSSSNPAPSTQPNEAELFKPRT
ncbi:MAG TPA: ATP-binding protein [Terracidiphilus sp.]